MSSIFPSVAVTIGSVIQTTIPTSLPLAKEYAWDFDNNNFLLLDGKHQAVTGSAAVKVWIWKCLKTPKNAFKAYDGNFGNDIETL